MYESACIVVKVGEYVDLVTTLQAEVGPVVFAEQLSIVGMFGPGTVELLHPDYHDFTEKDPNPKSLDLELVHLAGDGDTYNLAVSSVNKRCCTGKVNYRDGYLQIAAASGVYDYKVVDAEHVIVKVGFYRKVKAVCFPSAGLSEFMANVSKLREADLATYKSFYGNTSPMEVASKYTINKE